VKPTNSPATETKYPTGIPSISLRELKSTVMEPSPNNVSTGPDRNQSQPLLHNDDWNEKVTEDQIQKNWIRYARSIEEQNPRLYSMMYNQVPTLKNGVEVCLKLKKFDTRGGNPAGEIRYFYLLETRIKKFAFGTQRGDGGR
jgi:hypothetical protein